MRNFRLSNVLVLILVACTALMQFGCPSAIARRGVNPSSVHDDLESVIDGYNTAQDLAQQAHDAGLIPSHAWNDYVVTASEAANSALHTAVAGLRAYNEALQAVVDNTDPAQKDALAAEAEKKKAESVESLTAAKTAISDFRSATDKAKTAAGKS
jgi:hypothetical protein